MKTSPDIFIFTALPCEAKPVIDFYGLKKQTEILPFEVFSRDKYCLTVTGLGKSAMSAGVAYTQALFGHRNPVMVNVGIAGGQSAILGEVCIADKITDADSRKNFYPPLIYEAPCRTAAVTTVSIPQENYRNGGLVDMEASAFYETSLRFTSSELAQTLKIISDNETSSIENINRKRVAGWVKEGLPVIETLLTELAGLAGQADISEPENFAAVKAQWHFTVTQQNRLKQLLLRYRVLTEKPLSEKDMNGFNSAGEFLRWLEKTVEKISLSVGC